MDISLDKFRGAALAHLVEECGIDSKKYFPDVSKSLSYLVLCLCGESGELANIVKKIERGDKSVEQDFDALESEVADIFIYLLCIVDTLRIDLYQVYKTKREFNNERFIDEARTNSANQLDR
jgi:NTP pyrophosphatase (non-canonical NTP hydrolase)